MRPTGATVSEIRQRSSTVPAPHEAAPPREPPTVQCRVGGSPAEDLAREAALLDAGAPGIFVYLWKRPVLVLGRGQSSDTVDIAYCDAEGIPVLRRHTGGTGVLHDRTLNVALVLPPDHPWARTIRPLYARFLGPIVAAAAAQGVPLERAAPPRSPPLRARSPICFAEHTDDTLLLGGRKVFGSAQQRRRQGVLVHGTLVLRLDIAQQSRVFGTTPEHIRRLMTSLPGGVDDRTLADDIVAGLTEALNQ